MTLFKNWNSLVSHSNELLSMSTCSHAKSLNKEIKSQLVFVQKCYHLALWWRMHKNHSFFSPKIISSTRGFFDDKLKLQLTVINVCKHFISERRIKWNFKAFSGQKCLRSATKMKFQIKIVIFAILVTTSSCQILVGAMDDAKNSEFISISNINYLCIFKFQFEIWTKHKFHWQYLIFLFQINREFHNNFKRIVERNQTKTRWKIFGPNSFCHNPSFLHTESMLF